jgi:hypothetical protein
MVGVPDDSNLLWPKAWAEVAAEGTFVDAKAVNVTVSMEEVFLGEVAGCGHELLHGEDMQARRGLL